MNLFSSFVNFLAFHYKRHNENKTIRQNLGTNQKVKQICDRGRQQGGQNGHFTPLELGTKKQKFLENVKSGI